MTTETRQRTQYITHLLDPGESAGDNSHGARTNAEWLRAECVRGRAAGMPLVVVSTPAGTWALARDRDVRDGDEVLYACAL